MALLVFEYKRMIVFFKSKVTSYVLPHGQKEREKERKTCVCQGLYYKNKRHMTFVLQMRDLFGTNLIYA